MANERATRERFIEAVLQGMGPLIIAGDGLSDDYRSSPKDIAKRCLDVVDAVLVEMEVEKE